MPTETVGSSGRDRTTLQTWEDNVPATLTEDCIASCYNDSEFTVSSGAILTANSHTGSFWMRVRCASGQSFRDHANVRTNALRYNASNGVGFRSTSGGYDLLFDIDQPRFEMDGIQINTGVNANIGIDAYSGGVTSPCLFKDLLLKNYNRRGLGIYGTAAVAVNVLCSYESAPVGGSGLDCGFLVGGGAKAIGCGAVVSSDATPGSIGARSLYADSTLQSCYFLGFTTAASASAWNTTDSQRNATDLASGLPGSNNRHSVSFTQTTPLTDADKDSWDLRSIASTDLASNGYYDGTNAPNDISATARNASTPTIGPWELSGGGGGPAALVTRKSLLGVGL